MAWRLQGPARSRIIAALFALGSFAAIGAKAQTADDKASLTWAVPPFAPAFITDRKELTGYAAATQNWFASRLSHYNHKVLQVPLARLLAEMKNGEGDLRCSTTLIPTDERRAFIHFAKTILLHLPISVVVRAEDAHKFDRFMNDQGHIELSNLLADPTFSSAIRIGRAYGSQVDQHLDRFRDSSQVMQVADDTKFLRMLNLQRIDWTLYFPSEAEFYRRRQTPELAIKALPISGNTTLLEATIGCADTPAGQKAIAEINHIIDQNPTMPWTDFYAQWLNPNDREWFKAARDQYINSDHIEARLEYSPAAINASNKQ